MRSLPTALRCYLWLVYLTGTGIVAVTLALVTRTPHPWLSYASPLAWQIAVFVVLTYLGERTIIRIGSGLTQTLATSAHIAAILLFPAPAPVLITAAAVTAAQVSTGNRPLYKRAFNVAHTIIAVGVCTLLYSFAVQPTRVLRGDQGLTTIFLLVLLSAIYYVVDVVPMVGLFSIVQQRSPWHIWLRGQQRAALTEISACAIGVLAAVVWLSHPLLLALFVVPIAGLRIAFRAIKRAEDSAAALRKRGEQLEVVLAAGQDMRLHHTQADLLVPVAEAARTIAEALSATVYLADPDDPEHLQRIALLPLDAETPGPTRLPRPTSGQGIRDLTDDGCRTLLIPLEPDGEIGALLHLSGVSPDLTEDDLEALTLLATQATIALQNARLHERALAQSSQDGLTGLLNHRAFQMRLEEEIARAQRAAHPLGLLIIDLDDFGMVNNRFGHQAGDATLVAIADTLRATLRASDVPARYGGDEFAVILPETTMDDAAVLAERISLALRAQQLMHRGIAIAIGASIGVAALPLHATTREGLIGAADQASYAAKRAGKGRVCRPEEAALALDQEPAALAAQLANANMATVEALAAAVDAKDPYTRGHSLRVSAWAAALARAMDLPEADVARVQLAGVLHDVGKIGVPDAILTKPGALTADEFAIIKEHPATGERMLMAVPFLRDILPAVRHHHERWDGQGYPDRLRGESIPSDAAILMVADSFDAMTSSRTYRPALPFDEACRRVREGSGTQFAPRVVAAFNRAIADGSFLAPAIHEDAPPLREPIRSGYARSSAAR